MPQLLSTIFISQQFACYCLFSGELSVHDKVRSGDTFNVVVSSNGKPIKEAFVIFLASESMTDEKGIVRLKAPIIKEDIVMPINVKKERYLSNITYISITAGSVISTPVYLKDTNFDVSDGEQTRNSFEVFLAWIEAFRCRFSNR